MCNQEASSMLRFCENVIIVKYFVSNRRSIGIRDHRNRLIFNTGKNV